MKTWYGLACLVALMGAEAASAQTTDPVDRNKSGGYVNAAFSFGQANKVGGGSGGAAWFLGIEPGYTMARDTWARFEVSAEVGTGHMAYKHKEGALSLNADADVKYYALIKGGYGYSIGDNVFAVWRAGVGPASVSLKDKANGITAKADSLSALVYQVSMDVVSPMSDAMAIFGGITYRIMSFNINEYKTEGVTKSVDQDVQVNIPMVQVGVRMRF